MPSSRGPLAVDVGTGWCVKKLRTPGEALEMANIDWPWAIVLCKWSDKPVEIRPAQYYVDFYTENGVGGVCDYWRTVSCNALDLTNSEVFGWFTMSHASAELTPLHFPNDRYIPAQWGIDTAQANGVDLSRFR